jgi:hypothetical protein
MKYKKKPVIIEAVQFDGTDESVDWLLPQLESGEIGRGCAKLYIKTLEGVMEASIGDYIIKGAKGEFYPCKPDIFKMTYENVREKTTNFDKITESPDKLAEFALEVQSDTLDGTRWASKECCLCYLYKKVGD